MRQQPPVQSALTALHAASDLSLRDAGVPAAWFQLYHGGVCGDDHVCDRAHGQSHEDEDHGYHRGYGHDGRDEDADVDALLRQVEHHLFQVVHYLFLDTQLGCQHSAEKQTLSLKVFFLRYT